MLLDILSNLRHTARMDHLAHLRRIDQLVDATALSRLTGLSAKYLYALASRGEIPHYRIGRAIRFGPAEVADWLMRQRCGGDQ